VSLRSARAARRRRNGVAGHEVTATADRCDVVRVVLG
jgi:hypothetical protein